MPYIPDASSVTRLRAIQSSAVTDPSKRSTSYIPSTPSLLYSLRASDAGRGMFPAESYLSNPVTCGYVNPQHQGFITGPPTITFPVIQIPLPSGVDFTVLNQTINYDFELNLPPGPNFDAIFVAGAEPPTNIQDIIRVSIESTDYTDLFLNTTISTTPEWPGTIFTPVETAGYLDANPGTFPGFSTIIRFRNVPVIPNIIIRIYGAA
jgi:hypothetical protein